MQVYIHCSDEYSIAMYNTTVISVLKIESEARHLWTQTHEYKVSRLCTCIGMANV